MKQFRIMAACIIVGTFSNFVHAQETPVSVQERASRLMPAGAVSKENVHYVNHGSLLDAAKPIVHKRRARPLAHKKIEAAPIIPDVPVVMSVQRVQEQQLSSVEIKNNRLTIFGIAFGVALIGTVSFLFFFIKKDNAVKPISRKAAAEKNPVAEKNSQGPRTSSPMAAKIIHVAKDRLEEEAEVYEKEKESPKRSGEVELSLALQELRAKNQIIGLVKAGQKKGITKKSAGQAKKLGTGIGELELANRLAKLSKMKMQEEPI